MSAEIKKLKEKNNEEKLNGTMNIEIIKKEGKLYWKTKELNLKKLLRLIDHLIQSGDKELYHHLNLYLANEYKMLTLTENDNLKIKCSFKQKKNTKFNEVVKVKSFGDTSLLLHLFNDMLMQKKDNIQLRFLIGQELVHILSNGYTKYFGSEK